MSDTHTLLGDTAMRIFADHLTEAVRARADRGEWPGELWAVLEENGFTRLSAPEAAGGIDAGWRESEIVLRAAGGEAVPLPLAETILAASALGAVGLDVPAGALTVAPTVPGERLTLRKDGRRWRLHGTASRVPWAARAAAIVVLADRDGEPHLALVATGGAGIDDGLNIAREPRETVTFDGVDVAEAGPIGGEWLPTHGALVRATQMAGALDATLALTVAYANERVQFGRPIGKFQAIQQQLAVMAGEVAAAGAACRVACKAADEGAGAFEAAVAKVRAGEAAGKVAAIAHQTHGAIGFTDEYRLHHLTRRLWSWRAEFGGEAYWAERLGREALARGADALWPYLTDR